MDSERVMERAALLQALSDHIGRHRGLTAAALCRQVIGVEPTPADERALRALVEALRSEGHHICAHPRDGYYIAATPCELDETCNFLYARAMASLKQIAAMKRVSVPDLRGQLRLPS